MRVAVSVNADRDLLQINYYLRQKSPKGAKSVTDRVNRSIERLASFPTRGAPRNDLGPGLRILFVAPYSIIYAVRTDYVIVLRILHGSRDIEAEFKR